MIKEILSCDEVKLMEVTNIIIIVLLILLIVALVGHVIVVSTNPVPVPVPVPIPVPVPVPVPAPNPAMVGGCAGTRYGCCPYSSIAKLNAIGSNCPIHQ